MPLALVLAVTVLTHLAFAGARVAVALLALHLGASAAVVGVLAALFPALPMFFSVAAGRAIDRIGVVKPMLVGALAVAGGSLAAFAWPTLEALYAVSVVIGSGAMLSHIASNNAVGAIGKPPDRPRNFTLISLAFSTATFVGPVLAGLSIDGLGHARAFLVVGAFAVASAATIVLGRARFPAPDAGRRARGAADGGSARHPRAASRARGRGADRDDLGDLRVRGPDLRHRPRPVREHDRHDPRCVRARHLRRARGAADARAGACANGH